MKILITTIIFLTSINLFADVVIPKKCDQRDLNRLQEAHNFNIPNLEILITQDIIPNIKSCVVTSPRLYHPAVCGRKITELSFYKIITQSGLAVDISTSTTYISCHRNIRTYLHLRDFSMKPIIQQ